MLAGKTKRMTSRLKTPKKRKKNIIRKRKLNKIHFVWQFNPFIRLVYSNGRILIDKRDLSHSVKKVFHLITAEEPFGSPLVEGTTNELYLNKGIQKRNSKRKEFRIETITKLKEAIKDREKFIYEFEHASLNVKQKQIILMLIMQLDELLNIPSKLKYKPKIKGKNYH